MNPNPKPSRSKLLARVELAIEANGGPDYDEKACECDVEVNAAPCRYCAIRDALNETQRWLLGLAKATNHETTQAQQATS